MSITRLGMLLSTDGFQAVRKQIGGIRLRGLAVYQHNSDEINAMRNLEIYRQWTNGQLFYKPLHTRGQSFKNVLSTCPPVHIQYIYQPLDFYNYEQYAVCVLTTVLAPPYHHIPLSYVEHHKSIRTKINCNFGSENLIFVRQFLA